MDQVEKLLFVDIETTGKNSEENQIWSLSGYVIIEGSVKEKFDFQMCPETKIVWNDWALDNFKDDPVIIETFPYESEVFQEFISILSKYVDPYNKGDKFHAVGYKVDFDTDFLRVWFKRMNPEIYYGSFFYTNPIDVMDIAGLVVRKVRDKFPNFKLSTVCRAFDIDIQEHNSMSDITATLKLYALLTAEYLEINDHKLIE